MRARSSPSALRRSSTHWKSKTAVRELLTTGHIIQMLGPPVGPGQPVLVGRACTASARPSHRAGFARKIEGDRDAQIQCRRQAQHPATALDIGFARGSGSRRRHAVSGQCGDASLPTACFPLKCESSGIGALNDILGNISGNAGVNSDESLASAGRPSSSRRPAPSWRHLNGGSKYAARPHDKRRARAGSDRAGSGVGHCGHPEGRTTRPACLGQATEPLAPLFGDANVICLVGLSILMQRVPASPADGGRGGPGQWCEASRSFPKEFNHPPALLRVRAQGMRFANCSLVAKIYASCIIGCLATLMPLGRGALVGCVGRLTGVSSALLNGCGSGTANPYRSYSADEQLAKKDPRRQARPKPGSWAVWAPSGFGP